MNDRRYALVVETQLAAGESPVVRGNPALVLEPGEGLLLAEPVHARGPGDAGPHSGVRTSCHLEVTDRRLAILDHHSGNVVLNLTELRAASAEGEILELRTAGGDEFVLETPIAATVRTVIQHAIEEQTSPTATHEGPVEGGVLADGEYDRRELEEFVERLTGVDRQTVVVVLDMYDEYMATLGIVDVPNDHQYVFYDPSVFPGTSYAVDTEQVAADAERLLGIQREIAQIILDGEFAYLEAKGMVE